MYIGNVKLKQIILPSQRKECVWENLNKFHRIFLSKFEFIDPLEPLAFLSACHLAFLKTSCMTKERTMFNNSALDPLFSHFVRLLSLCTNATVHEISILFIKQPWVLFSQSFCNFHPFRDCLCILSPTDYFPLILQVFSALSSRLLGHLFANQEPSLPLERFVFFLRGHF